MIPIKDDMLIFLNKETSDRVITKIIGVKIKDWDDDIGAIGEHFIVECEIKNRGLTKHKCYVDRKTYFDFINKSKSIIWEDGQ